jgi:hypothetical protein
MKGETIEINDNNYESLMRIGNIIDNEELVTKCIEQEHGKENLSISNCIRRITIKEEFGHEIEEEMKFIAKHFYEFQNKEELKTLSNEILEGILSSESLCLLDEDSLVEFISSLGHEYLNLYRYVECRYLSKSGIEMFVSGIDESRIDAELWGSICRRLQCEVSFQKLSEPRFKVKSFHYVSGHEFEGIIHELTQQCGGNIHEKGIVNITCSSCWGPHYEVKHLVNHGTSEFWSSKEETNSWICFDFCEKRISLEHYTLKSRGGQNINHLIQWEVERSNDGSTWTILDKRNTRELAGMNLVKTFECCGENQSTFSRYIRLRQTGKNSSNADCITLCNIEFFGDLK